MLDIPREQVRIIFLISGVDACEDAGEIGVGANIIEFASLNE